MRFTSLVPALLVGAAVAAPVLDDFEAQLDHLTKRQVPVRPCSGTTGGLHLLVLGGANSNNPREQGRLGSLAGKILAAIPGSSNVSVPYNKMFQPGSNPPQLYSDAIPQGMNNLKQYTVQYHGACPNTKMAIIGYSSGGIITMNDLCTGGNGTHSTQLNPAIAGNTIVGQVLYGEETFLPGQPYNRGTCTSGHGVGSSRRNLSLCKEVYTRNMQSYCDSGDPDCCVGQGTPDTNIHFVYPSKYDTAATQFIVDKFNQYRNQPTVKQP